MKEKSIYSGLMTAFYTVFALIFGVIFILSAAKLRCNFFAAAAVFVCVGAIMLSAGFLIEKKPSF